MELENRSVREIARGYTFDNENGVYCCSVCGKSFQVGEIFAVGGRLFEATLAVEVHMEQEHGGFLQLLIENDSKYNTLTDHQKQLARLFASGRSDKEIARELGVSTSTIRHQKFVFREKAKQAKMYLALYERVFERRPGGESAIVPVHDNARMVDERYGVTEEERQHILDTSFSSLEPLRLKVFSPREKKKLVVLARIAELFEKGRKYNEREVSQLLKPVYEDFATLRRYLIQYGFMERTKDGSAYWRP